MNKKIKALSLVLCAVLLVVVSVMGTLAYLTSQTKVVTNTFTAGNVVITLDEAKVDEYGQATDGTRVTENSYKLIPGHTYVKDPTIRVAAGSEDCWIFAVVADGLGEASTIEIAAGWTKIGTLDGNDVYAYTTAQVAGAVVTLFSEFTFGSDADPAQYENAEIVITGYAVQYDGFDTADEAWNATFGA